MRFSGQGLMSHTSTTTISRFFERSRGKALSTIWFGLSMREDYNIFSQFENLGWVYSSTIFFGIFIYIISGQYKGLTRYTGSSTLYIIAERNLAIVLTVHFY